MEQIRIEIINVAVTTVPTARGSYKQAEVTYKNKNFQDKVEAKKLMDFASKNVFDTLSNAKFGELYTIGRDKNDKGFWDWKAIITEDNQFNPAELNEAATLTKETKSMITQPTTSPRSTYETPEERARRQVLIVRQSSVSSAIEALKVDKKQLTSNEIIDFARELEDYVMNDRGGTNKFASMPEDPI